MTFKDKYSPKIQSKRYLRIPVGPGYQISEGFVYHQEERKIHGVYLHKAIDYALEYGAPIYAAASGFAVSGYNRFVLRNKDASIRTYQGLPIGSGFGYFVQIYHPEEVCGIKGGRITQYGHLSHINQNIILKEMDPIRVDILADIENFYSRHNVERKFKDKIIEEDTELIQKFPWVEYKYGLNISPNVEQTETFTYSFEEVQREFENRNNHITWVEQGQVIGNIGLSGILWGELTYPEAKNGTTVVQFLNWDEPHLHFEEASRNPETRLKYGQRDPYGIYKSRKWYQDIDPKGELFLEG